MPPPTRPLPKHGRALHATDRDKGLDFVFVDRNALVQSLDRCVGVFSEESEIKTPTKLTATSLTHPASLGPTPQACPQTALGTFNPPASTRRAERPPFMLARCSGEKLPAGKNGTNGGHHCCCWWKRAQWEGHADTAAHRYWVAGPLYTERRLTTRTHTRHFPQERQPHGEERTLHHRGEMGSGAGAKLEAAGGNLDPRNRRHLFHRVVLKGEGVLQTARQAWATAGSRNAEVVSRRF